MALTKPRKRKCKACKKIFKPARTFQVACSLQCALIHAEEKRRKKERRDLRERKRKLKTKRDYLKEVQTVFNRFIRLRDRDEPCISCGRDEAELNLAGISGHVWDCGHYRTIGACVELRFDEDNANKQCRACNRAGERFTRNRDTVQQNYRKGLEQKIGKKRLERLEQYHAQKHYTIEELIALKKYYQQKCRELEKQAEVA